MALTAANIALLNKIEREMARKDFVLGTFLQTDLSDPLVATEVVANNAANGLMDGALADNKQVSTVDAEALDITKLISEIDSSGAESRTLAAPGANVVRTKIIKMTVDGGDVTLAGTNVLGDEAQTFTFAAVGDTIVLLSNGGTKWILIGGNLAAA